MTENFCDLVEELYNDFYDLNMDNYDAKQEFIKRYDELITIRKENYNSVLFPDKIARMLHFIYNELN